MINVKGIIEPEDAKLAFYDPANSLSDWSVSKVSTAYENIMKDVVVERKNEMLGLFDTTKLIMAPTTESMIDYKLHSDIVTAQAPSMLNQYDMYNTELMTKPARDEELSKIHEELSNLSQVNNELRKERKTDQKRNDRQQEEIVQLKKEKENLKAKLKKEKSKEKTKNDEATIKRLGSELRKYQLDTDKLQGRMNELEAECDMRKEFK